MKILIREHDPCIRDMHMIMFRKNHVITLMPRGKDYYHLEYLSQFHVIIVSEFFPEVSGYKFVELARKAGYIGKIILLYSSLSPMYISDENTKVLSLCSTKEVLLAEIQP